MAHEILENDNMIYVGETPWHGLGIKFENAPTIQEALIGANLTWNVRKSDIVVDGQNIPQFKAIKREDTDEVFAVVSNKYSILQNTEAFDVFEPLIEYGDVTIETAGSLKNGRNVWILGKINTEAREISDGDFVNSYILLSNTHDGKQSLRYGFSSVRVVCNNTLSMAINKKDSKLIRIFHKGNIKKNIEELRDIMNVGKRTFETSVESYRMLAKTPISIEDIEKFVDKVYGEADTIKTAKRRADKIINLITNGRSLCSDISKATVWDAYNAINESFLYHQGNSADTRLSSAWFGVNKTKDEHALKIAIDIADSYHHVKVA